MVRGSKGRRRMLAMLALPAAALFIALQPHEAAAQKFPSKPIRMIIPTAPGGGLDIVARQLAQQMTTQLGHPVLIESIAGASQQLGTQAVVRSAPDGYTVLFTASTPVTIAENFDPKPAYDARRDLVGLAIIARNPGLFAINANVKANTMEEFVVLAKSQPGKFFYGTPGTGHVFHLITELFSSYAGIQMTHVPFKGSAPAVVALLSGDIQFIVQSPEAVKEHIRAGKLRALATVESSRLESYPNVPTLAESGLKNLNLVIWYGVLAPSKTPGDVVEVLERTLVGIAKGPEFTQKLKEMNFEPFAENSREFSRRMTAEFDLWPGVVKAIRMNTAR